MTPPETINLYLSDAQAAQARALALRYGEVSIQWVLRKALERLYEEAQK